MNSCCLPLHMSKGAHCPSCCWQGQSPCYLEGSQTDDESKHVKEGRPRRTEKKQSPARCWELVIPLGMVLDFLIVKPVWALFLLPAAGNNTGVPSLIHIHWFFGHLLLTCIQLFLLHSLATKYFQNISHTVNCVRLQ